MTGGVAADVTPPDASWGYPHHHGCHDLMNRECDNLMPIGDTVVAKNLASKNCSCQKNLSGWELKIQAPFFRGGDDGTVTGSLGRDCWRLPITGFSARRIFRNVVGGRWQKTAALKRQFSGSAKTIFWGPKMGWRTDFLKIAQISGQIIWPSRGKKRVEWGLQTLNNSQKTPPPG